MKSKCITCTQPYIQTSNYIIQQITNKLGCSFDQNNSGMFLWAKIHTTSNAIEFADHILEQYELFITPGSIFGSNGEGYLRFSLCTPIPLLQKALDRI